MAVIKITKENFENEVLNSAKTVLLDFYADWCAPCQMMAPVVEEISNEREDIKVGKIDVDTEPELAAKFGISSIPLLAVVKDRTVINTALGYRPKDEILNML